MSKKSESELITSYELSHSFFVKQKKLSKINILSVYQDKILISEKHHTKFFIYNREGSYRSTISLKDNDTLSDVTWTPRGNIVYSTIKTKNVVTMLESGEVISEQKMDRPACISVSNYIIYLADYETGVYQSTDDGVSWSHIFKPSHEWHCWHVIKANLDQNDGFWALEMNGNNYQFSMYAMDKNEHNSCLTRTDIILPIADNSAEPVKIDFSTRLLNDGFFNVFFNDTKNDAIYLWSVEDDSHRQLLSSHQIYKPCSMAIDETSCLLFIGQANNEVKVFTLKYGKYVEYESDCFDESDENNEYDEQYEHDDHNEYYKYDEHDECEYDDYSGFYDENNESYAIEYTV